MRDAFWHLLKATDFSLCLLRAAIMREAWQAAQLAEVPFSITDFSKGGRKEEINSFPDDLPKNRATYVL